MTLTKTSIPTRRGFADRLKERGAIDPNLVVFDSDIRYSTYTHLFGDAFPGRYFNLGIAEINTFAAAAGMALDGRTVVIGGYSIFMTLRAVEVVRSFMCYPNLNIKLMASHGGLTAAIDGVTHQATEDIAIMSTLPNMKVLCPCDPVSASAAHDLALDTKGPVFIRLMRDGLFDLYPEDEQFRIGGSKIIRKGDDVTIVSYGDVVFQALEAAETLASLGIQAEVIDAYSIKPWDRAGIFASIARTGALVVAENHQKRNGLGYEIAAACMSAGVHVPFLNLGLSDCFAESGNYLKMIDRYGFASRSIVEAASLVSAQKRSSKC